MNLEANVNGLPEFYSWPQQLAEQQFPTLLHPHLPTSNPLYNRLLSPLNVLSRHCLFAATFPVGPESSFPTAGTPWTILFSDRSRHSESQIWIFSNLLTVPEPTAETSTLLESHVRSLLRFLVKTEIPDAPGWPFRPQLYLACLHDQLVSTLLSIIPPEARPHHSVWANWNIRAPLPESITSGLSQLPEGFSIGTVPDSQLDIVLATSTIKRQPDTLRRLPNAGLLDDGGILVAWGYIGVDGSFATLFVVEEHRGKGLATVVASELMMSYGGGKFASSVGSASELAAGDETDAKSGTQNQRAYDGSTGWVHSDVKIGNKGSEGVMRRLGGEVRGTTSYIHIDTLKVPWLADAEIGIDA